MGILNLTPDSFSDGGLHAGIDASIAAGCAMMAAGAAFVDVGAESTRPGAHAVPVDQELMRLLPVVRGLVSAGVIVSVDTRNAATMRACLHVGVALINDVSGLTWDPASAPLLAERGCRVVLMHMRGTPENMDRHAQYTDVTLEVRAELSQRRDAAERAGIHRNAILLDPGLGFAKTGPQNLALLRGLRTLAELGSPLVVGASRKRFVGDVSGEPVPHRRLGGSVAAALLAAEAGAAIVRVHDVAETVQALRVWQEVTTRPAPGLASASC